MLINDEAIAARWEDHLGGNLLRVFHLHRPKDRESNRRFFAGEPPWSLVRDLPDDPLGVTPPCFGELGTVDELPHVLRVCECGWSSEGMITGDRGLFSAWGWRPLPGHRVVKVAWCCNVPVKVEKTRPSDTRFIGGRYLASPDAQAPPPGDVNQPVALLRLFPPGLSVCRWLFAAWELQPVRLVV